MIRDVSELSKKEAMNDRDENIYSKKKRVIETIRLIENTYLMLNEIQNSASKKVCITIEFLFELFILFETIYLGKIKS